MKKKGRPIFLHQLFNLIGLSKERPILDHHAKAHIFEIQRILCEIHPKPYKIRCFNKKSSVWGVQAGGYDPGFHEIMGHSPSPAFIKLNSFGWNICFYKVLGGFHMKSARFHVKSTRFHEIERPLARNCNPMFYILWFFFLNTQKRKSSFACIYTYWLNLTHVPSHSAQNKVGNFKPSKSHAVSITYFIT